MDGWMNEMRKRKKERIYKKIEYKIKATYMGSWLIFPKNGFISQIPDVINRQKKI